MIETPGGIYSTDQKPDLSLVPQPAAFPQPPSFGPDLTAAPEVPSAPEAPQAQQVYVIPVEGSVDWNKAIEARDDATDEILPARVLMHDARGAFPVVVVIDDHGDDVVRQFDHDGETDTSEYTVRNVRVGPQTVYVAVCRDDESLFVDDETYETEEAAGQVYGVVAVGSVTIPVEGQSEASAPNVDVVYVAGRNRRVGEEVAFNRPRHGLGLRYGKIVAIRSDRKRCLKVAPYDGSNPYWALNSSVQG
jgi:hypothetical protein